MNVCICQLFTTNIACECINKLRFNHAALTEHENGHIVCSEKNNTYSSDVDNNIKLRSWKPRVEPARNNSNSEYIL